MTNEQALKIIKSTSFEQYPYEVQKAIDRLVKTTQQVTPELYSYKSDIRKGNIDLSTEQVLRIFDCMKRRNILKPAEKEALNVATFYMQLNNVNQPKHRLWAEQVHDTIP